MLVGKSLGNATVQVPEDDDPNHGGGPIRRSPLVVTRSGDGMPPYGSPQMVLRTPHAVVYEPEPGGATYPGIHRMKFLPDGRVVAGGALGGALGDAGQLSAKDAAARIQAQYLQLQQLFGKILETYNGAGLKIPCDVRGTYNRAVYDYLHTTRTVIDAIYKAGGKIYMTVLAAGGTPVLDSSGKVVTRESPVPLQPGNFTVSDCPAGTSTAYLGEFGDGALGASTAATVVGLSLITVGGAVVGFIVGGPIGAAIVIGALTVVGADVAVINWPSAQATYQANVVTAMNASLQCLRDATASGVTGQAAADRCKAITDTANKLTPPSDGLGVWAWVGIIATVAVAGAGIYAYMRHRRRAADAAPASAVAGVFGRSRRGVAHPKRWSFYREGKFIQAFTSELAAKRAASLNHVHTLKPVSVYDGRGRLVFSQ